MLEEPAPWHWPDLYPRTSSPGPDLGETCVQPCMGVVMMGDINGVMAAQLAHVEGLSGAGLLPGHIRLRRHVGVWGRRDLADVYIDDVATLAAVKRDCADQ